VLEIGKLLLCAVFFLSHNREAREKVYEEVDRNSKAGIKEPRFSDLSEYPYVEQVPSASRNTDFGRCFTC
jgi:hypothetical protein